MPTKKAIHTIRLDWCELDYFKHINNVSFFKYIQSARVSFWNPLGINKLHAQCNIGPMLVSCKCDFKMPLFFPDEITIESQVFFTKNSSFSFQHNIFNGKKELVATAEDVMVLYDFTKNVSLALPNNLREQLNKFT